MTYYETITGEAPLGYHELQERAELGRKTARQLRAEFLGQTARHTAFSVSTFCRELKRVGFQLLTNLADRYRHGHPA